MEDTHGGYFGGCFGKACAEAIFTAVQMSVTLEMARQRGLELSFQHPCQATHDCPQLQLLFRPMSTCVYMHKPTQTHVPFKKPDSASLSTVFTEASRDQTLRSRLTVVACICSPRILVGPSRKTKSSRLAWGT